MIHHLVDMMLWGGRKTWKIFGDNGPGADDAMLSLSLIGFVLFVYLVLTKKKDGW